MSDRALMALFDQRQRLELRGGYWIEKEDDNQWQIGQGRMALGYSLTTNVPVGKGGSFDAEAKRFAEVMQGRAPADQAEAPDMPIAEAREWLKEIRRSHEAYLKTDIECKIGYADKHRKRIAAIDVALHAIELLSEG
ncbi:MAG: hypothetical protein E5V54_11345 [Mesorhizobium sp.]|nr:MAG: hypothetical protein E5V54_11345 [Mesorhizobium sp.]TIW80275.1 MAG: hypothetical protein E5V53_16335 [Mesorhizobium sp.]